MEISSDDSKQSKSGTENKQENAEYKYMPETYNDYKDRFGIIFHDKLSVSNAKP